MTRLTQGFVGTPDVSILADGINMMLNEDFVYVSAAGIIYTARRGLVTDGGSVPRFFWRTVGSPWTGKRRFGYIIHDQLCQDLRKLPPWEQAKARLVADRLLHEICVFLGDPEPVANIVYSGVRIGWYWECATRKRGE